MTIEIPDYISKIIYALENCGYEAFIVGGCVRDFLLNKTPQDWDITTNATPDEVSRIFKHVIPTGIKHGTVTVIMDNHNVEVTTYRTEGKYSDFRRPDSVSFTRNLYEDLSRRDFTMNAIAYSPSKGFIDYFEGMKAIKNKLIETVGNSEERFKEDALRMMRAIRFSITLGFSLSNSVLNSIIRNHNLLSHISIERIRDEFIKSLQADHADKLILYKESMLLSIFLPEVDEIPINCQLRIYKCISRIPKENLIPRLAGLFIKFEPTKVRTILRRLKFDNNTINSVDKILSNLYPNFNACSNEVTLRKIASRIGTENLNYLIQIWQAFNIIDRDKIMEFKPIYEDIYQNKYCLSIKDLAIDGNDLIDLGIKEGSKIGTILKYLLEQVLIEPSLNTKDSLIAIAKEIE